jgi:hypothetical protein
MRSGRSPVFAAALLLAAATHADESARNDELASRHFTCQRMESLFDAARSARKMATFEQCLEMAELVWQVDKHLSTAEPATCDRMDDASRLSERGFVIVRGLFPPQLVTVYQGHFRNLTHAGFSRIEPLHPAIENGGANRRFSNCLERRSMAAHPLLSAGVQAVENTVNSMMRQQQSLELPIAITEATFVEIEPFATSAERDRPPSRRQRWQEPWRAWPHSPENAWHRRDGMEDSYKAFGKIGGFHHFWVCQTSGLNRRGALPIHLCPPFPCSPCISVLCTRSYASMLHVLTLRARGSCTNLRHLQLLLLPGAPRKGGLPWSYRTVKH